MTRRCDGKDFVQVVGPGPSPGSRLVLRHKPNHELEAAEARPVKEGQPIPDGSIVIGPPEADGRRPVIATIGHAGPAQVASDEYRDGWERIFGGRERAVC